jgi:hypothetical protein
VLLDRVDHEVIKFTHLKVARIVGGVATTGIPAAEHMRARPVNLADAVYSGYLDPISMGPLVHVHVGDFHATRAERESISLNQYLQSRINIRSVPFRHSL